MQRHEVLIVALPGRVTPPSGGGGEPWRRLEPDRVTEEDLSAVALVVLGSDALLTWQPRAFRRRLWRASRRPVRVLLCPDRESFPVLPAWTLAGFDEFVDPANLRDRIGETLRSPLGERSRYPVAVREWCPRRPAPGSRAERAVLLVPSLERTHSVSEWASILDVTQDGLAYVTDAAFGITPKALLDRYVVCQTRMGLRDGRTLEEMAGPLGFSEGSCLSRVLRRNGWTAARLKRARAFGDCHASGNPAMDRPPDGG